ncbi:MAG: hypothetical protein B6I20_06565 [Bacteroidetes bacterium 4572_117]|nr:MAG: hypothetical protein B6I20_06565 [Bacteroidetes bacterium 4572_117]
MHEIILLNCNSKGISLLAFKTYIILKRFYILLIILHIDLKNRTIFIISCLEINFFKLVY